MVPQGQILRAVSPLQLPLPIGGAKLRPVLDRRVAVLRTAQQVAADPSPALLVGQAPFHMDRGLRWDGLSLLGAGTAGGVACAAASLRLSKKTQRERVHLRRFIFAFRGWHGYRLGY